MGLTKNNMKFYSPEDEAQVAEIPVVSKSEEFPDETADPERLQFLSTPSIDNSILAINTGAK